MARNSDPFDGIDNEDDTPKSDSPEGCDFQVEKTLQESDKAIQVVLLDTGDVKWVPKSVIHDDSEVFKVGDSGKLVILRWFAEREKWL